MAIARKRPDSSYRARIRVAPRGGVWLSFNKERGGSPAGVVGRTVLVPGWRYGAGLPVDVRFQVLKKDATQLRLKVWPAGSPQPRTWQLVSEDRHDDIGAGGRIGLGASLTRRATGGPVQVRFEGLVVDRAQDAVRVPVSAGKRRWADRRSPAPAPAPAPQAPAAVAPQAPAPAPAPAAPPPSSGGVAVPASIDATGSTNVSAALQGFINGVPNGSTIVFRPGTTYRIVAELKVVNRQNLTFEGNGARLDLAGTSDERGFYVRDSAGITIRGFTMVGNNTEAGTPATCCGREGAHAVALYSTTDVLVEDMDISRVWGDCFYVNASTVPGGTWSRRSTFRDSTCTLTGRHGIGIIRAADTTIANNRFDAIGFDVVDLEPGAADAGATGFVFRANVVGTYGLTDEYNSFLLAACGAQGAAIRGVTITGNTVAGNRIGWSGSSGRPMKALHVRVCGDEGPRSDFVVTDNVAGAAVAGPAMHFASVAGVTVTGNVQPLSSGQLASFPGSTNVTYRP
jgi:hypothetical protein